MRLEDGIYDVLSTAHFKMAVSGTANNNRSGSARTKSFNNALATKIGFLFQRQLYLPSGIRINEIVQNLSFLLIGRTLG
jgi:hypothetical protein